MYTSRVTIRRLRKVPKRRPSLLKRLAKSFKQTCREYCASSNLHGVHYLGENRTLPERTFWLAVVTLSLIAMSVMVLRVWQQWQANPALLSFSNTHIPTWLVPFPSITICPPNKYKKSAFNVQEFARMNVSSLTNQTKAMLADMLLICKNYRINHSDFSFLAESYPITTIRQVSPSLHETVDCWHPFNRSCLEVFQTLLTPEGVCFSYNLLPNMSFLKQPMYQDTFEPKQPTRNVWSLFGRYDAKSTIEDIPTRGTEDGIKNGRIFVLTTNENDVDKHCRINDGFQVALTNPADIPRINHRFYTVPVQGLTVMAVEPTLMSTSRSLRSLNPRVRGCYFPEEKQLAYFSTFTYGNCLYECKINLTLQACSCVEFYMPRNMTTRICGIGSKKCLDKVEEQTPHILKTYNTEEERIKTENPCGCLKECQSVEYNSEISQGFVDLSGLVKHLGVKEHGNTSSTKKRTRRSIVIVYLKDSEVLVVRRTPYYEIEDFIANCGGLLSLCCGFSVLSIAEVVYYFTLRLWSNTRQPGRRVPLMVPKVQIMPTVSS